MISTISRWCSDHKVVSYASLACVSGTFAHVSQKSGMPLLSFALKIIASLSASQASIHVGKDNLFLPIFPKTFNPLGLGLALLGTIAMPTVIGWGLWSVFCEAEKIQRIVLLMITLGIAKRIGIPEFP